MRAQAGVPFVGETGRLSIPARFSIRFCYNRRVAITKKSVLMPLMLFVGWSLWAAINLVGAALKSPAALDWMLHSAPIYAAYAFLASGLMFLVYDRVRPRPGFRGFALLVPVLCYVAALWTELISGATRTALGWTTTFVPTFKVVFLVIGLRDGLYFALFSMMYFVADHWLQLGAEREKAREANAAAQRAQLQMLRYQLNPHFLFNALNSLRAMVLENPVRAREIVTEISDFLRYSLDRDGSDGTIGDEIAAIENYLAIQRMRFEKKLAIAIHVEPAAKPRIVPCFLIHPLVENAVKFGMDTSPMPLRLKIVVTQTPEALSIRVSNTGRLVAAAPANGNGTGTGLKNVVQRLALAYPERHTFNVAERDGWVHAEIRLRHAPQTSAPA